FRLDGLGFAGHHFVAGLQAVRGENVVLAHFVLLVARIFDERDASAAVGIVLDRNHRGLDLVALPFEVDLAVHPLVAAAAEPRRDDAVMVAAALLGKRREQRLLGAVGARIGAFREIGNTPAATARRCRLVLFDAHSETSKPTHSHGWASYQKNSILSSRWSDTTAFFHEGRWPMALRKRRLLPLRFMVRTAVTRTPNNSSTAA